MNSDWNLDQIRDQAESWSLQGDAGMLDCLVKISQNVIQRAESTNKRTNNLCVDLDRTACDLMNITNSFTALTNKQYIENRVAEEEPIIAREEKKDTNENTAARNKAVRDEVVRNSLAFVDKFFDVVEVPADNHSEGDGTAHPRLALRPKATDSGLRLPYMIGTKEFEEDDYIGLGGARKVPAEAAPEPVDEMWESTSEVGIPISGKEATLIVAQSNQSSQKSSSIDDMSNDVGYNYSPPAAPPFSDVKVSQPKIPSLMSAYSPREPPPLFGGDEDDFADDEIFGAGVKFDNSFPGSSKEDKAKDLSGSNLFDENDDDLFGSSKESKPETEATKPEKRASQSDVLFGKVDPAKKLPPGAVSIFGNRDVMPQQPKAAQSPEKSAEPEPPAKHSVPVRDQPSFSQNSSGLFSEESDDDLFSPPSKPAPKKLLFEDSKSKPEPHSSSSPSKSKKVVDLFGESNEENDEPPIAPKRPVREEKPKLLETVSKKSLFSDSESDEDIFSSVKTPATKGGGLFDDDSEDLFQPSKSSRMVQEKTIETLPVRTEEKVPSIVPEVKTKQVPVQSKTEKIESEHQETSKPPINEKPKIAPTANPLTKKVPISKAESKSDLFSSTESDDSNLFASQDAPVPRNIEREASPKKVDTKAVSVSQGVKRRGLALNINPLALLPGSKPQKTPTPTTKSPDLFSTPTDAESPKTPEILAQEVTPVVPPVTETPPETNLPPKPTTVDAANFDEAPTATSQLSHLGKERVRIQQKRKPPSRKGQTPVNAEPPSSDPVSPAAEEDFLFVDSPVEKELVDFMDQTPDDKQVTQELGPSSIFYEPPPLPSAVDDIFGDDDDLFSDPLPVAKGIKESASLNFEPPPLPSEASAADDNDLFGDSSLPEDFTAKSPASAKEDGATEEDYLKFNSVDLFPGAFEKENVSSKIEEPKESEEIAAEVTKPIVAPTESAKIDIFGFDSEPEVEGPGKTPESSPPKEVDEHSDIFGNEADIFSETKASASSDSIFESQSPRPEPTESSSDGNDLFYSFSSGQDTPHSSKASEEIASSKEVTRPSDPPLKLDEDSDDDDFLFGASSKVASSKPAPRKEEQPKPIEPIKPKILAEKHVVHDIFGAEDDDDDDLFGSSVLPKTDTPSSQNIPKKQAASALFPDDASEDLFGEQPGEKKKPLQKKKQSSSALFGGLDDEEDDLFGSASSSVKPKATLPKSIPKSASKDKDFDDPLLGGL